MKTFIELDSRIFWLLVAAGASIMAIVGCTPPTQSGFETDEESETTVDVRPDSLNITAIGVPNFSSEIARQWAAERDAEVNITHVTVEQFLDWESSQDNQASGTSTQKADLFVHPSAILADLISDDLLRVYPRDGLMAAEMNLDSYLPYYRKSMLRHADKTWSVSLGGHQLRLFYRSDILQAADIEVPETWEELGIAIDKLKQSPAAKEMLPLVVPDQEGIAVHVYLARAVSQLRERGKLTSFFDRRTMKPMLEAPVFVEALNDLRSYGQFSKTPLSVSSTFETFASGRAVFAIAWPAIGDQFDAGKLEAESSQWSVTRLPGSQRIYDLKESVWRDRKKGADPKVDLLGIDSTSISIAKGTAHADDAVEFVTWLSEKQNSRKLLQDVATPFRATHLGRIGEWYGLDQADSRFLTELADSIDETHRSSMVMTFPLLPGRQQYLRLLDEGVRDFLNAENGDAKATLEKVSAEWQTLTDSLGRENQIRELRIGNGT